MKIFFKCILVILTVTISVEGIEVLVLKPASAGEYSMWSDHHTHERSSISFAKFSGDGKPRAWSAELDPLHLHYVSTGSKEIANKYFDCKQQDLRLEGDSKFSIIHRSVPKILFLVDESYAASVVLVEYEQIAVSVANLECVSRSP